MPQAVMTQEVAAWEMAAALLQRQVKSSALQPTEAAPSAMQGIAQSWTASTRDWHFHGPAGAGAALHDGTGAADEAGGAGAEWLLEGSGTGLAE